MGDKLILRLSVQSLLLRDTESPLDRRRGDWRIGKQIRLADVVAFGEEEGEKVLLNVRVR